MVRSEVVHARLADLARFLDYLRRLREKPRDAFLADFESVGSARYWLQVAIEACIDVGSHILSSEGLRSPLDYRDVFRSLGESGVVPAELARRMEPFAGLRNILVHQYHTVDDGLVYEDLQRDLATLEEFERAMHAWLARET